MLLRLTEIFKPAWGHLFLESILSLGDSLKRRGIRLNGFAIRQGRITRGWSQADLADKAGVAERTVRNAESGAPVKHHVADFVAGAREIGVNDLILDRAELPQRLQWQQISDVFQTSLDGAVINADFAALLALVASPNRIAL